MYEELTLPATSYAIAFIVFEPEFNAIPGTENAPVETVVSSILLPLVWFVTFTLESPDPPVSDAEPLTVIEDDVEEHDELHGEEMLTEGLFLSMFIVTPPA